MNEEYRVGRVSYDFKADFNERVEHTDDEASSSEELNVGYFYLQEIISQLKLKKFFSDQTADLEFTFDCYTIPRFLICTRILEPSSKRSTCGDYDTHYETGN